MFIAFSWIHSSIKGVPHLAKEKITNTSSKTHSQEEPAIKTHGY